MRFEKKEKKIAEALMTYKQ